MSRLLGEGNNDDIFSLDVYGNIAGPGFVEFIFINGPVVTGSIISCMRIGGDEDVSLMGSGFFVSFLSS